MGRRKKLLNWDDAAVPRRCEQAGCAEEAVHRTPRSPDRMEDFRWLCLGHARQVNAGWDFFGGMSRSQIERFQKEDVVGHRPTWPVGVGPISHAVNGNLRDHFGIFSSEGIHFAGRNAENARSHQDPQERRALAKLDLRPDSSLAEIKNRYKKLVKRFHPDLNDGDKRSEELFKDVNEAYAYLMTRGYT